MRKLFFLTILIVLIFAIAPSASAKVVLAPDGTIYSVEGETRRGFPSAVVFFSHGYSFSDAAAADSADLALPAGAVMTYAEGTLVKGSDPAVFIISDGKKRPFVSAEVFLGLGYSFSNIILDEGGVLGNVLLGDPVSSQTASHPAGTLVNDNGTIYLITLQGKKGIPSVEVFNSYFYKFKNAVPANSADKSLQDQGNLALRQESSAPAPSPVEEPPKTEEPAPAPTPPNEAPAAPTISGVIGTFPVTNETYKITSTDPQGDNITYSVDWGDGNEKIMSTLSSGSTLTVSHGWSFIGEYTISVKADDGKGHSASATHLIKVNSDTSLFGPAVTVLTPNGGESYTAGQVVKITWRRNWMPQQAFGKADIYYRRAGFNTLIKADAPDGSYDWVPTGTIPAGSDFKIVVISQGNPGGGSIVTSDESDGFFSITGVLGASKTNPQPSSSY